MGKFPSSGYKRCSFATLVLFILIETAGAAQVEGILVRAEDQVGTPYRSGGIRPGGFDCSGFVTWLFKPTVPNLPRVSRDQARFGIAVSRGEWRPGDLLFYATGSNPNRINHVAVWYGSGRIIHSISDGPETGVVITPADARYWSRRYVSARRILPTVEEGVAVEPSEHQDVTAAPEVSAPPSPIIDNAVTESSPSEIRESPWNDFEGYLRGDFEAWKAADEEAFEAYKKENG